MVADRLCESRGASSRSFSVFSPTAGMAPKVAKATLIAVEIVRKNARFFEMVPEKTLPRNAPEGRCRAYPLGQVPQNVWCTT